MVLNQKETTVAYRCPECGAGVMSAVGLFSLSADMMKLKCSCGKSEMKIVYQKEGPIRLSVPCLLCGTTHNFTVNRSVFFDRELFVLSCPYSDVNICMIGEMNNVKAELARTELELLDMLEENGVEGFDAFHGDEQDLPDPEILNIIMYVIRELDEENKIYCKCRDDEKERDYDVTVENDGIRVTCKKCGAARLVPTDSRLGAHAFLNADSLHLE